MGCPLTVELENGEIQTITGYTCRKGEIYARKEVTNPTRIVTSTVRVEGGRADMVSVKTREDIPKDKIFQCVKAVSYTHLDVYKRQGIRRLGSPYTMQSCGSAAEPPSTAIH